MSINRRRILRPFQKVLRTLEDLARNPGPDEVHQFRLRLRRIEAVLDALEMSSTGLGRRLLRHERPLRVRAGKIHDLDVFTHLVQSLPWQAPGVYRIELLEFIGAERYRQARKLHKLVRKAEAKLRKELNQCIPRLEKRIGRQASMRSRILAAAMIRARILELGAELARYPRLSSSNLHLFRIRLRHMRRILQMVNECESPFFLALVEAKDAIGDWHDLEKLTQLVRRLDSKDGRRLLLAQLKPLRQAKLQRAIQLAQRGRQQLPQPRPAFRLAA